ncbi:hypothetical protein MHU86_4207 [Fragilaria crotonensis]|nr:hypothetical protein MHU86_4207 [Fragilaria crotonensis]
MTTPTRLEDVDISTLVDIGLPTDLLNAITTAQLDLASISIERESMEAERAAERVQTAINFETERATTNRRIRGLEEALGALASERPDAAPSSADELPAATGTYADLDERIRMSASDKAKLYATFVKGSSTKFKAASTIVGVEEISTIENVSSLAQLRLELQKHITGISVHPVFLVLKFDHEGTLIDPDTPEGTPTNLLSVNILPPIAEVEQTVRFYHRRGSTFNRDNLVWSFEAVRNSCDKDLQAILDAQMLKYPATEHFGPLYYYELIRQMTDVDSKAIRAITQELTSLKVVDQDGQSITKTSSIIRSTIIWLEMVSMVPPDIDAIVLEILETCTVPDFQLFLKTLVTNASLNQKTLTHIDLLLAAENHYRTLIVCKKWDAIGHQGSSFQAQRLPARTNATSSRPRVNMPPWSRTAPLDGEPHEKVFETTSFKWCSICQRWFFGHRAHLTNEHQSGYPPQGRRQNIATPTPAAPVVSPPSPSVHLAASHSSEAPVPSSLSRTYFTGGL